MGTEMMPQYEETEEKIVNHLEEWILATNRSPINKSVGGFLRSASPALNILAKTRVAAFVYDYENGSYSYFNDYFPILLNSTRRHIEKVGIRVMEERVHPEDFIKCLNLTRRTLEEFSKMKEDEKDSTQLRLFFRVKRKSGDYVWVLQSNRQVRWSKDAPALDLAYMMELFDSHNPMKVMTVLQTSRRVMEFLPDGETELLSQLSMREMEVLRLVATGFSTKELANKLVVSENTIKTHRRNLIRKLGVRNIAQAIGMLEKLF